jgi:hypothetical protein
MESAGERVTRSGVSTLFQKCGDEGTVAGHHHIRSRPPFRRRRLSKNGIAPILAPCSTASSTNSNLLRNSAWRTASSFSPCLSSWRKSSSTRLWNPVEMATLSGVFRTSFGTVRDLLAAARNRGILTYASWSRWPRARPAAPGRRGTRGRRTTRRSRRRSSPAPPGSGGGSSRPTSAGARTSASDCMA